MTAPNDPAAPEFRGHARTKKRLLALFNDALARKYLLLPEALPCEHRAQVLFAYRDWCNANNLPFVVQRASWSGPIELEMPREQQIDPEGLRLLRLIAQACHPWKKAKPQVWPTSARFHCNAWREGELICQQVRDVALEHAMPQEPPVWALKKPTS